MKFQLVALDTAVIYDIYHEKEVTCQPEISFCSLPPWLRVTVDFFDTISLQ